MSELDVDVVETPPELEPGKTYKIVSAELMETERHGYKAVELICHDGLSDGPAGSMLWTAKRLMANTKLGTFVNAFGKDLSKWRGKKFDVLLWEEGKRQVVLHK